MVALLTKLEALEAGGIVIVLVLIVTMLKSQVVELFSRPRQTCC
jgi:hypothetical protein